jgi:hypothetical protein
VGEEPVLLIDAHRHYRSTEPTSCVKQLLEAFRT